MGNQYGLLKQKMVRLQAIVNRLEYLIELGETSKSSAQEEINNILSIIDDINNLIYGA